MVDQRDFSHCRRLRGQFFWLGLFGFDESINPKLARVQENTYDLRLFVYTSILHIASSVQPATHVSLLNGDLSD